MIDVVSDIELAVSGTDASAFARLRTYILSPGRKDHLYDAVSVYLEESPVVDWAIAERFVRYAADPSIAAAAINAAALRRCPSAHFWTEVEEVARGEAWDQANEARVQAILALNRQPEGCSLRTRQTLLICLEDDSAAVRDSAAIAAQRCLGIPEPDIAVGGEEGNLIHRVPDTVKSWLKRGDAEQ